MTGSYGICEFSHRVSPTVLETDQLEFPIGEDDVFDEMNLVEIPFALPHMRSAARTRANLTADGSCYLATSEASLPTAVAQRVVLGLLWMTKEQNGFKSPQIEFTLRRLVQSFMYPDRRYRANARTLQAVSDEIYRIMATQIHHDRWYDRNRGRHIKVAAAIFDNVQQLQPELGLGSPISLRWGHFVYESVRASYTKPLDLRTWLKISNPIDQTLYRWLDRQLATKDRQLVRSCQNFARYKLLLESRRLSAGGRSASSYVVDKLKVSLERLNGIGVAVRMVVDTSRADFALEFQRIEGSTNEVVQGVPRGLPAIEVSPEDRVVLRFRQLFHGLPEGAACTIDKRDRKVARSLLSTYDEEKLFMLLEASRVLHREGDRKKELLHFLSGAMVYFNAAEASLARQSASASQTADLFDTQRRRALWHKYTAALLALEPPQITTAALRQQAQVLAEEDYQQMGKVLTDRLRERVFNQHLQDLCLDAHNVLPRDQFLSISPEVALLKALTERHGFNPLQEEMQELS